LKEQVPASGNNGQVADLVHDQERGPAKEADALAQFAFAFGFGESADDVGKAGEADATAGFHGLYSSEGWNEKSKPVRVLTVESLAILSAIFTATVLAQAQFLGE